ncbi:MAG: helix-turn-helix domain-containing protein [Candidatus Melainabacteria bacterium]|jgi:transcriptional regulator with XRE-family HTH domain
MQEVKTVPASVKAFLSKIGNQLKEAREEQGLSREDICRALKIHINFLIALEEGLFEDLPGAASFFASLRSYARLLKLDADKIVEECKKNKYLFESFQGLGQIERHSKPDILHQSSNIIRSSPVSLPPVEIPNIIRSEPSNTYTKESRPNYQSGEGGGKITNSSQEKEEESDQSQLSQSQSGKASGRKINPLRPVFLSLVTFLILFSIFLFAPISGLKGIQDSIKSNVIPLNTSSSLNAEELSINNSNEDNLVDINGGILSGTSKICGPFKLSMEQAALIEVYGISGGQAILPQRIVQEGEELEFSDSRGIKIYTSSPDESILRYKGRKQDWSKIEKQGKFFVFKCN